MLLNKLCGQNTTFSFIEDGYIAPCFIELCLVCPIHMIFAGVCVYYITQGLVWERTQHNRLVRANQLVSVLIVAIMLAKIIFSIMNTKARYGSSNVLSLAIATFSWLLIVIYFQSKKRPPSFLCISMSASWAVFAILLSSQIYVLHFQRNSYFDFYTSIAHVFLQILAIIGIVVLRQNWKLMLDVKRPRAGDIQVGASEVDRLLRSTDFDVYYSGINREQTKSDLKKVDENSMLLSRLTFHWVFQLMKKGIKNQLKTAEDTFYLPTSLSTKDLAISFQYALNKLKKPSYSKSCHAADSNALHAQVKKRLLLRALHQAFGLRYYSIGLLKFFGDCLGFAGPLLLHALVSFMDRKEPMIHGYYYAFGLFASTLLGSFVSTHYNYLVNKVGLQIRAAIITAVYQKTLSVKTTQLLTFSTGEVVNFMSTDTDRIVNFCQSFHQFWSLPFQVAVSLYLLHQQVGVSFLAGLGFAFLLIPVNKCVAVKIRWYSENMMAKKDERVELMSEVLHGIRVIKFYAWERMFSKKISDLRSDELKNLKGMKYLDALCVFFWSTTPVLISILTFFTYVLLGNTLTAAKVFTSIALFNMLIFPLNVFPWVINGLIEAWVSLKRVNRFLELDELDWQDYYISNVVEGDSDDDITVMVKDGSFGWNVDMLECTQETDNVKISKGFLNEDKRFETKQAENEKLTSSQILRNIDLTVRKGHLVGVIGHVGSGKSSLLSAITADMARTQGKIYAANLNEGFALVAQEAWIQHATVKDNILFGKLFDHHKYEAVLKACALKEDLAIFPAYDRTEIGENGVNLSGGQKARISLARAVYQDKEIYLLDDPLAAVDTHVGSHIFSQCIMGALKHKTRILCTHHWKYLRHADVIVVMQNGTIACQGPPHEILKRNDLIQNATDEGIGNVDNQTNESENTAGNGPGLVKEETKDVGVVKYDVYRSYWRSAGVCLTVSILLSLFLMQVSRNISDWWLAYWISHDKLSSNHTSPRVQLANHITLHDHIFLHAPQRASISLQVNLSKVGAFHFNEIRKGSLTFYLVIYGGIALANTIFTLFRAFLFAYGGVKAAQVIHEKLLRSILGAPVYFFDVTPIGRIVNRFSSDTFSIDDSLPFMMNIFLALLFGVVGTICITCYGLPWFILLLIPLSFLYYKIQNYYRKTSREVKRLMSVSRSPVYAHFSESLSGIVTIRAFRASSRFMSENERKLELNQRANFSGLAASQWLNLQLQMLGVAMVTCVSFLAVVEHHFSTIDPGLVGLAISYALTITNQLSGVVTSFTETEKQMVSVERAMQYVSGVPQEVDGLTIPPQFWPREGKIVFWNVTLVYRPGLPPALRHVSFEIRPREKIGIVGRTGSGKSSLFLVLFKIVDIECGQVTIDNVDIAKTQLKRLRSSLAIIPQDPFLFRGDVRKNLDPTNEFDDAQIWNVLERCSLKKSIDELGGLQANVGERGRNLSCGQRQLLCLARALLKKANILCVDEATASVDFETDNLIQKTIREEFHASTVLTIAHRIETILDSDRVLVMDKGQVAEFDSPYNLQRNGESLFSTFVRKS